MRHNHVAVQHEVNYKYLECDCKHFLLHCNKYFALSNSARLAVQKAGTSVGAPASV
jgi:hypothetical protein